MIAIVKGLENSVGLEVGLSPWMTVDQSMIDAFADTTGDRQFIHVDPESAAKAAFGTTIAHGFLTLSLLSKMAAEGVKHAEMTGTGVNYGFDRVRFLSPVKVGARIRGRFTLVDFKETRPGVRRLTWDVTVEIEGQDKPALSAQWLTLRLKPDHRV
ncbi:MaoC family dehydratase [Shimia sp.]|uniref:MaoC family dehydratase n=1 Tax=Shimia sp. TaxID=1954381 RepID=UPI0035670A7E